MRMSRTVVGAAASLFLLVSTTASRAETDIAAILATYADIAEAGYQDSVTTARTLQTAIDSLIETPNDATLAAARSAWIEARVPYQQTEAYRFGNLAVDEWEGKVNAWPLDEGLIDYVDTGLYGDVKDDNRYYAANIIANPVLTIGGETVDSTIITPDLLRALHEIDAVEANVATGYHAIEFLLWGQDLNGTDAGAGDRPATDYASADACTNGNCDRRAAYLQAVTALMIADLEEMAAAWGPEGTARTAVPAGTAGLSTILTGLGSLSYGELAGERMQLGLMLHDPEEEHDCFSDNTHNSHFYDVQGIANVYRGTYTRIDGTQISGASLADLVKEADAALDTDMQTSLDNTLTAMGALKERADSGVESYDQMMAADNAEGNAMIQSAIDALVAQTRTIERIVAAIEVDEIAIEGSDSLDRPETVLE